MNKKKSQQEIVGFVLIVIIVMVGLMVFLVFSFKNKNSSSSDSIIIKNLLYSVLNYKTECAIKYEPEYDSFEDLIKSCYEGKRCSNLNRDACNFLKELSKDIIENLLKTESQYDNYQFKIYSLSKKGEKNNILELEKGNFTGSSIGAEHLIISSDSNIKAEIRLYSS